MSIGKKTHGQIYKEPIKQPSTLVGCKLGDYLPWQSEDIEKDGKMSESQAYYAQVRGEICRFIAKDGKDALKWYFMLYLRHH